MLFFESVIKMPLMALPVRSVLLKLKDHKNILISPGSRLRDSDYQKMNNISDIVAPSLFHCGGVTQAVQYNSKAKVWGVPGAKDLKPSILWSDIISESTWPYGDELEIIFLEGMPKVNEVIFLHKETKSLIVADLCFNLLNQKGVGSWIILNLFGTYNKLGISRFFLKFVEDQKAFQGSINKILQQDFENIILSHGDNVISGAKPLLANSFKERGFVV